MTLFIVWLKGQAMKISPNVKPALWGAVGGAIAAMIVGFAWGGWVTGGTAEKMAVTQSGIAVVEALVPVCVALSVSDPAGPAKLEQLAALKASYERTEFVMKAGWATMPTAKEPNRRLAEACAELIAKAAGT
jgi:hypothetical protein